MNPKKYVQGRLYLLHTLRRREFVLYKAVTYNYNLIYFNYLLEQD